MYRVIGNPQITVALKEKFSVSNGTISNAFHFKRFSQRHSEIRSYAINKLNASLVQL